MRRDLYTWLGSEIEYVHVCAVRTRARMRIIHHAVFIDVNINVVRTTASEPGTGATLTLGNAPYQYRLQRKQFVASRLTIFAAQPRTMDRSNARLGEVVKRLFKGLLAVFRVRKLNTQ